MIDLKSISIEKAENSHIDQVDYNNLGFGKYFTDHMFLANYQDGKWQDLKIVPFGSIPVHPAMSSLHYGQSIFEGIKATKNANGEIVVFRPEKNFVRMNNSAKRLCMAEISEEVFFRGMRELLKLDQKWIPEEDGTALYIRPLLFATDSFLGVKPSKNYTFLIITGPVGAYYPKPVRIIAADKYVRAVRGGVGYAKAAGNYAASMLGAKEASDAGYDNVLWTDAFEHKYAEEIGTMNVMFVIDGTVITPDLSGTILPGVTRESVIQLLKERNIPVEERKISLDEIVEAHNAGKLEEAFGVGTAATISHISSIAYNGTEYELPKIEERKISPMLKETLEKIKREEIPDTHNWLMKI